MRSINRSTGARWLAVALLLLLAVALTSVVPAFAQRPNGAGVVIRFGDGSVIYAYVQFEEESITSEELLYRSGLAVAIAPFSGLGAGVCSINGEGCPSDDCFCKSYTTPAYFWHFYSNDGGWRELLQGASSRSVGDGEIDGWSWTAGESGLPAVTIDEIALMNGVDRNTPDPTPTETPTLERTSTPIITITKTPLPTATQLPVATATPPAEPTVTATATASEPSPSNTDRTAVSTSPPDAHTPTTSRPQTTVQPAPTPTLTLVASATTVAVLVQPDGTAVPVKVIQTDNSSTSATLLLFGGLVVVAAGAGAFVWVRNRRVA